MGVFTLTMSSSDPNLPTRLADAETCGFAIRVVWSAYDIAFLSSLRISA